jgi:mannan endo-1,4-beta-mannosidase
MVSAGKAAASYVIWDSCFRISNVAALNVTVQPDPTAAIPLASYETA